MPVRPLPSNPSLQHLKYQAKDLLKAHAVRDAAAAQRLREFHPQMREFTDDQIFRANLRLSDAQLAIAREAGFPSWARLKRHIEKPTLADRLDLKHHERIEDADFRRAVDLLDAGDADGLRAHLKQHPKLTTQHVLFEGGNYFRNPTLLEFIVENPIRHGKLPSNIVEVAKVILDAGVPKPALNETLGLVATGRVVRECGVQAALIELLCDYGADPSGAAEAAAVHNEFEALDSLLAHGAHMSLPIAAALGRVDDARRLLPDADSHQRQLALSMAASNGHVATVRLLLDAGADPSRYNPAGHAHTTPLHQAAGIGHFEVVRLMVERGARLDVKDVLWHGTPRGWAEYGGKAEVANYLRKQEEKPK
jgi:hypothetical protein